MKEKIAAHSEKEYIFSGEETLSYGLKGKYITHGYSENSSPGVEIFIRRPPLTQYPAFK